MTNLNWRYATKNFNPEKKLSEESLHHIIDAIRLSPSSYGLQPYKILVISDDDIRSKLKEASYGQSQVTDCSHLIVFCVNTTLSDTHVDNYVSRISETRQIEKGNLEGYRNTISGFVNSKTTEQKIDWAKRQAYLGLGFLLYACAEHEIDACPMEGFVATDYDTILGLAEKGLTSAVVAPIGYRSDEDKYQHVAKVRKSVELFVEEI